MTAILYSEKLLAPRPTTKLEDHRLSAVRDCLFSVSVAKLNTAMNRRFPWRWGNFV